MEIKRSYIGLIIGVYVCHAISPAAQLLVPSQYATIQAAIQAAVSGDEIVVSPKTYYETINYLGKAITVRSVNPTDWNTIQTTIINGNRGGSCVLFNSGETSAAVLKGLTLTKGSGTTISTLCGGGICCNNSSPMIQYCNITDNGTSSDPRGGGIAVLGNASPIIQNCFIVNNSGVRGGAFYSESTGSPQILSCTISHNKCTGSILLFEVDCRNSLVVIRNSIIYTPDSIPSILHSNYNLVEYNCFARAFQYSASPTLITALGTNLTVNPHFIHLGYYSGSTYIPGDYHLTKLSPCIDAGDPNIIAFAPVDIDNQPRIQNERIDIGADEFQPRIEVTRPAQGEVWAAGSNKTILWHSYSYSDPVQILYSNNNGSNWTPLCGETENTGSYLWHLPADANSTQCVVRVIPSGVAPDVASLDSNVFTIHPITFDSPIVSPWPSQGRTNLRNSLSEYQGPRTGCVKWHYSATNPLYEAPVIGADNDIIVTTGNELFALKSDGSLDWSFHTPTTDQQQEFTSSPAIGPDGAVYVGDSEGNLHAIDKQGQVRWSYHTDGPMFASPAVTSDGTLYFGDVNGTLYAVDKDGSDVWRFKPQGNGKLLGSPAFNNGIVYAGYMNNPVLYAINGQTGQVLWTQRFQWLWTITLPPLGNISGHMISSPVIGLDGTVYITLLNSPDLYALNPDNGSVKWSLPLNCSYPAQNTVNVLYGPSDSWSPPAIGPDGTIYVCMDDMYLWAVNPGGTVKWTRQLGLTGSFSLTIGADGLIYAACDEGLIYVLNSSGSLVSCFKGDQWLTQPVIGSDGTLYISDSGGKVWAIGSGNCTDADRLLYPAGDQDNNFSVDLLDFEPISLNWLKSTLNQRQTFLSSDFNRDGLTNLNDLITFCNHWLCEE